MTQHTPTPWEVNETAARVGSRKRPPIEIRPKGIRYQLVADDIRRLEDAQHIVRCVNAHDEFVAALRDALDCMDRIGSIFPVLNHDETWDDVVDAARAALAKVQQ